MDTPFETRAERVKKKRDAFYTEIWEKMTSFLKSPECPKDKAMTYCFEETDKWLNKLIKQKPQEKSFIMSVAFEIKHSIEKYFESKKGDLKC